MSGPAKRRATYQDVLDAPEHEVAEIIGGELRVSPRSAVRHARTASALGYLIGPPFDFGSNGPGGWIILHEPEVHLGDDIVVPDLAGWRRERMPEAPGGAFVALAPDWVCEVLSPRTAVDDRVEKLPIYARDGVGYVWLVDPVKRTLEVFRLHEGKWLVLATYKGEARIRAEPFEAIELDLSLLWASVAAPPPRGTRASEPGAEYDYES